MGRCDTASASIGIKILLSDLVSQINEKNCELIVEMLEDGCIEDSNHYYNEVYGIIIDNEDFPEEHSELKKYLTYKFTHNGSYYKSKFDTKVTKDLQNGCLFDKHLLVPIENIISTARWGYSRKLNRQTI